MSLSELEAAKQKKIRALLRRETRESLVRLLNLLSKTKRYGWLSGAERQWTLDLVAEELSKCKRKMMI